MTRKHAMTWAEYALRAREIAPRGEAASNVSLSDAKVRIIRAEENKTLPHAHFSRMYNVSANCIYKVRNYLTWVHVK